nr:hypothetical protein [Massilia sp. JS1662]
MKATTSIQTANIWAKVSAAFFLVSVATAIAAAIWEPRGLGICIVPLTVAVVAKQGEARVLRSALESMPGRPSLSE